MSWKREGIETKYRYKDTALTVDINEYGEGWIAYIHGSKLCPAFSTKEAAMAFVEKWYHNQEGE